MTRTSIRKLSALLVWIALPACDEGATGPEVSPPRIDGVWRATDAGVRETILELGADGTARLVEADLSGRTCASSSGIWSSPDGRLVLRLTPQDGVTGTDPRSFVYEVSEGSLVLTSGDESTTFIPATSTPSCLSYGFGRWQGTLSARIDDVLWSFTNIIVQTGQISAGRLGILACLDTAPSCDAEDAVLILKVSAPDALKPGTYPLGDQSSGFYGLVNPFPDDPDFPGFDSLRLLPTGALLLTSIAEERIVATFEFRANERATDAPPAPDGSTFALVTGGIVDLAYR